MARLPHRPARKYQKVSPATAFKDAIVATEVSNEVKVTGKARLIKHPSGIATNREDLAALYMVVFVQQEVVGTIRNTASVNDRLTIVFTVTL